MYLLDTNVVSMFFRSKGHKPFLNRRILAVPSSNIWISIIVVQEAIGGAYALMNNPTIPNSAMNGCQLLREIMRDYATFQIFPYDAKSAEIFKGMSAETRRNGANDCKIAATALAHGFTVITRNVQHFHAIPNVKYEDWTEEKIKRR